MNMRRANSGIRMASGRLVLREFVVTDEDAVHAFAADPLVTRFTDWGPNSVEDTRAFLAEATAQATNPQRAEVTLAAVHARSGRLIGLTSRYVTGSAEITHSTGPPEARTSAAPSATRLT